MKRVLAGGVAAGVALFVWGSISHLVLPLGEIGLRELPNQEAVLASLRTNLPEPGLYLFPGMGELEGMTREQQRAAMDAWTERYLAGPWGILVYHPRGRQALSPAQLLTELASNIAAGLVAAVLLAAVAGSLAGYGARVLFVAALGLLPGLDVDVSYWNWYGFPSAYTVATMADRLLGWLAAGLVLAGIVRRRQQVGG